MSDAPERIKFDTVMWAVNLAYDDEDVIEYVRADLYEQEHRNWMGMLWQRNWAMDQLEQLGHDELPPPMPDDYLSWSTE